MPSLNNEWNISFVGCGFLGIYYFGVYSCLLEEAQHLIKSASKICGASSGALTAAMIACEMSPENCCKNLMAIAKEARKGILSSMHPSFKLLELTKELMVRELPENAHLLASGKLCVSLTRLSDGKNVLVSEFSSKDDLIQVLFCSCFFPLYCGIVPPSYHGTRYVDGALSDSSPYSSLKNTIIVSPFSGESDICPYDHPVYCQEVRHCNMSININLANVHRVVQAFSHQSLSFRNSAPNFKDAAMAFAKALTIRRWLGMSHTTLFHPISNEVMAEICQNGYQDALRFLNENDFLKKESSVPKHIINYRQDKRPCFDAHACILQEVHRERRASGSVCGRSCVLDKQKIHLLPASIQKVFCDAFAKKPRGTGRRFAVKFFISILTVCVLPVEIMSFMFLRFLNDLGHLAGVILLMSAHRTPVRR